MLLVSSYVPAAFAGSSLSGDYALIDPSAQRKKIEAAIDALVEDMNVLIRGIARRRLKETVVAAVALRIDVGDAYITIIEPTQPKKRAPADGTRVRWENDVGDRVTIQMYVRDGELHERFRGQGNRDNVYRLGGSGERLTLRTKIFAKQFPRPLRFSLPYRRA